MTHRSTVLIAAFSAASFSLLAQSTIVTDDTKQAFKPNAISSAVKVTGLLSERRIKDEYIVLFKDSAPKQLSKQLTEQLNVEYRALSTINGFSGRLNKKQLALLQNNPHVRSIEANQVVSLASYENPVTDKMSQSYVTRSLAPGAWSLDRSDQFNLPLDQTYAPAATGAGVHAYIIDSGIHTAHIGFEGRADWVFTASNVSGGNGDNNGHGTHLAGNVGSSNYGIAKQVNLHAVKVLDGAGTGTLAGLIEGIDYVTNNHQKPAVATIGFNTPYSQALNDAISASIEAGVTYAVPVGDESRDACDYSPSSVDAAIRVASTWSDDRVSVYSNKGSCVDIYAPGLYVNSLWHTTDNATNTISHSPVSAAHVAGAAALVLGEDNSCAPSQVKERVMIHAGGSSLTEVPAGTQSYLLHVPDEIGPYIDCPSLEPVKVDNDLSSFQTQHGAELIFEWNEGVPVDQPLMNKWAAGIERRSYQFVVDGTTGETTFIYPMTLNFELGTKVFGFDVNQMSAPINVILGYDDFTYDTYEITSAGFHGFTTEKSIVRMELESDATVVLGNAYRNYHGKAVEVYSSSYQAMFEQQFVTKAYPDVDKVLEANMSGETLIGEQLTFVANDNEFTGMTQVKIQEIDGSNTNHSLIGSRMVTGYNHSDFTIEFNQAPNVVSFKTHVSGASSGVVTVYYGENQQDVFVINNEHTTEGFMGLASSQPITAIRFQGDSGSSDLAGVSMIASDLAVETQYRVLMSDVEASSSQSAPSLVNDGIFDPINSAWTSAADDANPWLRFYAGPFVPATHYRLSRGNCSSNDYLAGTWKVYSLDYMGALTLIDEVTEDQSAHYPMATACGEFGPTYQIDNPTATIDYKIEFTPSPLSTVSGVSIGEVEFLY